MTNDGWDGSETGTNPAQMWLTFALKMAQTAASLSPQATSSEAAGEMRSAVLEACEQSWDQFLRSPQFLAMMRHSMVACINWRKQLNECLGELEHQFQEADRRETEQMILAQCHLEQRMSDVIQSLGARLDEITARLDGAQQSSGPHTEEVVSGDCGRQPPPKPARKKSTATTRRTRASPRNGRARRTNVA